MYRTSRPYYPLIIAVALLTATLMTNAFPSSGKRHKEISQTNERELKVTIEAALGDMKIARSSNGKIIAATVESEKSLDMDDCMDYEIRDKVGFLNFSTDCTENERTNSKKHNVSFSDLESSDWWLNITDNIPVSFDFELGMGNAELDMTGLSVKDLTLTTGASSVFLRFDEPNTSTIEDMSIEAGLSKFHGQGLSNANFNHFRFEGGVGSYTLDFSGKLDHEVDVDIEIGLGSVTIIVPRKIGVKVYCEKNWISHLSIDEEDFNEREDDTYYSPNYSSASGKMNMQVQAGMGSVKIRRQ